MGCAWRQQACSLCMRLCRACVLEAPGTRAGFATGAGLLGRDQHLEGKLTDCVVAVAIGGVDIPRSTLLDLAQKRTYDASRRCIGFAAVTKAVQHHRLLSSGAGADSFHLSAVTIAHALMQFAHQVLTEAEHATGADAGPLPSSSQLVADVRGALEERIWDVQLDPAIYDDPIQTSCCMCNQRACRCCM